MCYCGYQPLLSCHIKLSVTRVLEWLHVTRVLLWLWPLVTRVLLWLWPLVTRVLLWLWPLVTRVLPWLSATLVSSYKVISYSRVRVVTRHPCVTVVISHSCLVI